MRSASFILLASLLIAQGVRIGEIGFFGLRTIPEERIRALLGVREGDTIAPSEQWGKALEKRIRAIPGVAQVSVDLGCCNSAGRATITVGIVEAGSPGVAFRSAPNSPVRLSAKLLKAYRQCMEAWEHAVRIGDNQDNVEAGHSLMANSAVRATQQRFIPLAGTHLSLLRDVVRNSASSEHRAAAAFIIGYAPVKAVVVEDLLYASSDANSLVRNNAMRSLWAIASLAGRKPELKIQIPADPFIGLLNSIVGSDRNKALAILSELTENRAPAVLAGLRERAQPALSQMAGTPDGFSAYLLLKRIEGMPEEQIHETWKLTSGAGAAHRKTPAEK